MIVKCLEHTAFEVTKFLNIFYPPIVLSLGDLLAAVERDFGSFDIFRAEMTARTVAVEGSGWGWLVSDHPFPP